MSVEADRTLTSQECQKEIFPEGAPTRSRIAPRLECGFHRLSLPFAHEPNEVAQFCQSALHLGDLLVEPKNPCEIPAIRSFVKGFDHGRIRLKSLQAAGISLAHQVLTLTPQSSRHLVQIKFGMVLHAPEHSSSMSDLDCLNLGDGVEGQQRPSFRQCLRLVGVESRSVKRGGPARKKRMVATCSCQRDAAGKACFPSSAAGANCSAGCHGGDLQAGTGAEGWDTRLEDRPHQINLAACLGRVLVEVKRRTGYEHRIVALELCLIR